VRATVSVEPRATLLPPDLFKRLVNDASWCNPQNIPEGLQVV
jgi:sulfotransferase